MRSESPLPRDAHLGPVFEDGGADRDRFDGRELAAVLSQYDLGAIVRIREYRRGSRRSPKVRIATERGEHLLKRRAPGSDDPRRVAFSHELLGRLAACGFPVPELRRVRGDHASALRHDGRVYELFGFVHGSRDDGSPAAGRACGAALALMHEILRGVVAEPPPHASFHASATVERALQRIPEAVAAVEPHIRAHQVEPACEYLRQAYADSARRVEELGFAHWPPYVVHGDWHRGNLLWRHGKIAAVLDFDSARVESRMTDVANAALQFSILTAGGQDPDRWPDSLDRTRIQAVLEGYDQATHDPMTTDELQGVLWLIVEALIQETVLPIAATGRFAHLRGSSFLRMVERKVRWLRPRAARSVKHLEG